LSVVAAVGFKLLRRGLPLVLLLLAALQGCSPLPLINGQTLYVMVVTQRRLDWLRRDAIEERLWMPLLEEFHRLHPNVRVSLYTVSEEEVVAELQQRTARGLGPDLVLLRAPMANSLLQQGLIAPVPQTPAMERSIDQLTPGYLERVRDGSTLAGLPLHDLVGLACYNRQKMPSPPRTTEELMALAASGRTIGISNDSYGIWWTAGTRDAAASLVPILLGEAPESPASQRQAEMKIAGWLAWLREVVMQSRVDLATGPEELSQGLISGRLDWIPCFSLTLSKLKSAMGDRLGVSALPRGPGGPASPFNSLQVWAFGLDSSGPQRQSAADLAQLSVDPFLQRRFLLESQEVLPVNRFVETPVASSGVLAALAIARRQFETVSPLLKKPFEVNHLNAVSRDLEAVIQQVLVGVLTPQEGAKRVIQLGERNR
jgi:arabinogalactan oligomer/maltooligosaccharide transport system substrate-binding protein